MATGEIGGGCQCGAGRFRMTGGLGMANDAHCRMCQRAAGDAFALPVAAKGVRREGSPARFAISDIAERGFCAACGTSHFHAAPGASESVDPMIGALDDPDQAEPPLHYGVESRLGWLKIADGLPRHETRPGGLSGTGPMTIETGQNPVPGAGTKEER